MPETLIATESFRHVEAGVDYEVEAGVTRVYADHFLAKRFPKRFQSADAPRPSVEQATAAPGEKRGERPKPRKKD